MKLTSTETECWRRCEAEFSDYIKLKGGWRDLSEENSDLVKRRNAISMEYYDKLHRNDEAYRLNNWLIEDIGLFSKFKYSTLVEVGCGNGRFAAEVAKQTDKVIGLDWAKSPEFPIEVENLEFRQVDIVCADIPQCDVLCSSDFLEHISPENLEPLVKSFSTSSPNQYHVIACYNDNHSHLTIMRPAAWLSLFKLYFPDAKLLNVQCRRNLSSNIICKIAAGKFI